MNKEKLLNVREAAAFLRLSEKTVIDLSQQGKIPAYKIGGVYLRFKKDQLKNIKIPLRVSSKIGGRNLKSKDHSEFRRLNLIERINNFLYFNDFYFLCIAICLVLLFIVFYT